MDVSSLVEVKKKAKMPAFVPGDTVRVHTKIVEGDKERIQVFQGVVIKIKHGGNGAAYTVRHIAYGIGVERTFPMNSPLVEKVEVVRHGKVRRSRLYYLRKLSGKEARRKIKHVEKAAAQVGEELLQEQPEEEIEPIMDEEAVAAAEAAEAEKEAEAKAVEPVAAEKTPEKAKQEEQAAVAEEPVVKVPVAEKETEPVGRLPAAEKEEAPAAEEEVTIGKPVEEAPVTEDALVAGKEEAVVEEPAEQPVEEPAEEPTAPTEDKKEENPQS
ncbi:MAG: 50S ribosomal protein L19 [Dehalococcoidales bacterium]|nr:50S ribosomal protein L19 [Dehalococcoidales bacterium]